MPGIATRWSNWRFRMCRNRTNRHRNPPERARSYSIDTVRSDSAEYGADHLIVFIIGLDAFVDLPSWKEADLLLKTCNFVVISRPSTRFLDLARGSVLQRSAPATRWAPSTPRNKTEPTYP